MSDPLAITISALKTTLADKTEEIARALLPSGRKEGAYWTVGSVQGERGRSLIVRLTGDRRGTWRDLATGEGGSILDLIMAVRGVRFPVAVAEGLDWLGHDPPEARSIGPDHDEKRRISIAREIWDESAPIAGSLGEIYLRGRGIFGAPKVLRYHPALRIDGLYRPAMIAAVFDSGGCLCGIHRTILHASGALAKIDRPKRALGRLAGGCVRLAHHAGRLGIAEGIETALAATRLFDIPVWATLGTAGLARPILPPDVAEVIIFADGDCPGRQAALKAEEVLRSQNRGVRIAWAPDGQDFADVLWDGGARTGG